MSMGGPNEPLHPLEKDFLLAGILASIAQQGKLTPEVMRLPGIQRGFDVLAREIGEKEAVEWAKSML